MAAKPGPESRLLDPLLDGRRMLLVVAAPTEARSIAEGITSDSSRRQIAWTPVSLTDRIDLLVSGVGKSNAAGATGRCLDPLQHALVVSIGVGGALPRADDAGFVHRVGDVVRCQRSVFADEGVHLPVGGWATIAQRGFGPRQGLDEETSMGISGHPAALDLLADRFPSIGAAATVSGCSGTDDAASIIAARSVCSVEAMEGAAVGLAALRIDPAIPFLELRVISNRTGADQQWDLPKALARLSEVAAAL